MKTMRETAREAKAAARALAALSTEEKNAALLSMAEALCADTEAILAANSIDMAAAEKGGMSPDLLDRLMLDAARVASMAEGLRELSALPDPVGEVMDSWELHNGLRITKTRVPMGLIGIIYEGRPNVTADAAGLCFKAGSSVILRCSSSSRNSCAAITASLRRALRERGLAEEAISLAEDQSREAVGELLRLREYVDLIVPRGGAGLIKNAVENSTVPVIETGTGNCHVYIDESADYDMAERIIINSKTQRTGVCNAMETLLVHENWAKAHLSRLLGELSRRGVELHGDEESRRACPQAIPATQADYETEYLRLAMAVRVLPNVGAAIEHINRFGTRHTECIVTENAENAARFLREVDAAVVNHNASTRFTDGFQFGFGAELGISTQKLHARGPMGLREITSYKYLVSGCGQVRG